MYAIIVRYREPDRILGSENIYLLTCSKILTDTLCHTKKELIKTFGWMLKSPEQIKNFYTFHVSRVDVSLTKDVYDSVPFKMYFEGKYQPVYLNVATQSQHLDTEDTLESSFLTKRQTKLVKRLKVETISDTLILSKLYSIVYYMKRDEIETHITKNSTIGDICG